MAIMTGVEGGDVMDATTKKQAKKSREAMGEDVDVDISTLENGETVGAEEATVDGDGSPIADDADLDDVR